ncbi:Energy-coupling factor transporter ATP-binding protein EcfA2 [Ureibacillus acetophenoni]
MDIKLQQVSFAYSMGTPFEKHALFDVDLEIPSGTYQAVIGHTGSGKSTILQHFNGLLKPSKGEVHIGERVIVAGKKAKELKPIRQKVGIVFQFPTSIIRRNCLKRYYVWSYEFWRVRRGS